MLSLAAKVIKMSFLREDPIGKKKETSLIRLQPYSTLHQTDWIGIMETGTRGFQMRKILSGRRGRDRKVQPVPRLKLSNINFTHLHTSSGCMFVE